MSELQQNARRNDAGEKDGDDSAMKSRARRPAICDVDAQQNGVAGHQAGKCIIAQIANRVGISCHKRKQARGQH